MSSMQREERRLVLKVFPPRILFVLLFALRRMREFGGFGGDGEWATPTLHDVRGELSSPLNLSLYVTCSIMSSCWFGEMVFGVKGTVHPHTGLFLPQC